MTLYILIIISGTIFLAGILILLGSSSNNGKKDGSKNSVDTGTKRKIAIDDGVDTKKLTYGSEKGAIFGAGQELYGTVFRGGGRRRVWKARFDFLDDGGHKEVTFQTRMAIGRTASDMKKYPHLEIPDDKMVSSVHCFLSGTQGILTIQDAKSKNHTYLNGHRVDQPTQVPTGSVIRVGQTRMRVTYEYR